MSAVAASLPERPSLEHMKAQAKDLLSAVHAGNPDAVARILPYFPDLAAVSLNNAHTVIAREYGFTSWSKLKAHVLLSAAGPDTVSRANALIEAAIQWEESRPVAAMLAEDPAIGGATLAAACVTGNAKALRAFLDADPALLNAKVAPKDWEPLLYVCFSSLLKNDRYRPRLIETARMLIARGSDVNARWPAPQWGTEESCIYGATGVNDCPELAEMLLKAGANPNDGESMYHSTELPEPTCLKLLLEHGGSLTEVNALGHMLDREEPEWLRMMLSYAKDPAQIPSVIPFAMRRGRSTECIRILIESGMDLNATDARQGGRTPYQMAMRLGRFDAAEMLAAAGADTALSESDALLGRLARGEQVAPSEISRDIVTALNAEKPTPTLVFLAERGSDFALEALLAAGADINVTDSNGWTGLHHAALHGRLSTVRILLRYNADPNIIENAHNADVKGFACYGSLHIRDGSSEEYVEVVRELLDAGAKLPETPYGSPEVQELLVARGVKPAA